MAEFLGSTVTFRLKLFVDDGDASLDFYRRVLRFKAGKQQSDKYFPLTIVLEVDDIDAIYKQVLSTGWPLSGELQRQPWGRTDFRLLDPDGYYLRITTRG